MTALRAFLQHPVSSHFIAVFAISWGGALTLIGPGGIPGPSAQVARLFPVVLRYCRPIGCWWCGSTIAAATCPWRC
jgi:hypothetical protein